VAQRRPLHPLVRQPTLELILRRGERLPDKVGLEAIPVVGEVKGLELLERRTAPAPGRSSCGQSESTGPFACPAPTCGPASSWPLPRCPSGAASSASPAVLGACWRRPAQTPPRRIDADTKSNAASRSTTRPIVPAARELRLMTLRARE
jgi:hypothetical protein